MMRLLFVWLALSACVAAAPRLMDFVVPAQVPGRPPVRTAELQGRPAVVAFWAFWCVTWKEVHSGFSALSAQGVQCVAVSIDCQWMERIEPLLRQGEVPYRTAMDPHSRLSHQWGVKVVPTVFVLDRNSHIVARFEGYPGDARLLKLLRGQK